PHVCEPKIAMANGERVNHLLTKQAPLRAPDFRLYVINPVDYIVLSILNLLLCWFERTAAVISQTMKQDIGYTINLCPFHRKIDRTTFGVPTA
ncbi:hypothetical protein GGI1_02485, partial [Acidithiobacillus sp. GGI-221]